LSPHNFTHKHYFLINFLKFNFSTGLLETFSLFFLPLWTPYGRTPLFKKKTITPTSSHSPSICSSTKCEVCSITLNRALFLKPYYVFVVKLKRIVFKLRVFVNFSVEEEAHEEVGGSPKDEAEVQVVLLLMIWCCFVV
jgi:hypothetical protein